MDPASKYDLTAFVVLFPADKGYEVLPVFWIRDDRMRELVSGATEPLTMSGYSRDFSGQPRAMCSTTTSFGGTSTS